MLRGCQDLNGYNKINDMNMKNRYGNDFVGSTLPVIEDKHKERWPNFKK